MGIMTESRTLGTLKLQTMVDSRVACIAKNYSVDELTKLRINQMDKKATMPYEAPSDPLDPVFISAQGPNDGRAGAQMAIASDDSDEDRSRITSQQLRKSMTSTQQ